jgi:hypothetical protein
MIQAEGNIHKMRSELTGEVSYFLPAGVEEICMNDYLGREISFEFTGLINCIACGKPVRTSLGQGFCYNCFQTAPEASESVLQPELSRAHFGIARSMEYAVTHDLIDHFVYLAQSPGLKVGVTRYHQVPTRWIDQGAIAAIPVARTPNRHIAGIAEVWLKQFYSDKTNWRDMLQNKDPFPVDLTGEKRKVKNILTAELRKYYYEPDEITHIRYPVLKYPIKAVSHSFDKDHLFSGILTGIRGQYLILDDGKVLNVRKHNGYFIKLIFR